MNFKNKKLTLSLAMSTSFTLVLLLAGILVGWFNYIGMKEILLTSNSEAIKRSGKSTILELQRIYDPVEGFVKTISHHPIIKSKNTNERLEYLPFLRSGLEMDSAMSAVYIGYEDGSFFLLREIGANYKPSFSIPEGSKYLVQTIEVTEKATTILFFFYNAKLEKLNSIVPENYEYDPRTRDWYQIAITKDEIIRTDPYIFFTTREVGKTIAYATEKKEAVIGADVTLGAISESLVSQKATPSTQIILIDSKKNGIAYLTPEKLILNSEENGKLKLAQLNQIGIPIFDEIDKKFDPEQNQTSFSVNSLNENWLVFTSILPVRGEKPNYLIIASPEDELLLEAKSSLNKTLLITVGLIFLTLQIILLISKAISHSIINLTDYTSAIRNFDFSGDMPEKSKIKELDELGITVGKMKMTIQKFLDISSLLIEEKDFNKLMHHILSETASAVNTEAGILYILSEDEKNLNVGGIFLKDGSAISIENLPIVSLEVESSSFPIQNSIKKGKTSVIRMPSAAFSKELSFFGSARENQLPYMIGVPLKNQDKDLIGYLCLFEKEDVSSNISLLSFIENLSGTTSVAIENHRNLDSQKKLFDSFIRTIAWAIDAKSSNKLGHCSKVPEIAIPLANATLEQEGGTFGNFKLTEFDKYSLEIGAWLHDIGSIITPEFILQKSTKLEAVYDRLNEIRLRFEIIKRDLRISYYKKLIGGASKELLDRELEKDLHILDEEFLFIAACNDGDAPMTSENVERIRKIGMRTWERTLSDTVGLSYEERQKKSRKRKPNPNVENLIADRPEHFREWEDSEKIPEDNEWNFKMKAPKYKYNLGELHNLTIGQGVLNEEEMYLVNSHIIHTIKMLSKLPFPKNLKNVAEIAGGHHEHMDGTGFPKGVTIENLSVLSRIIGISDKFETLTSANNAHKKGKTLSEVISIMDTLRNDKHLDSDLFEIFLSSGIYIDYAKKHMEPYQIDEVDISNYVKYN